MGSIYLWIVHFAICQWIFDYLRSPIHQWISVCVIWFLDWLFIDQQYQTKSPGILLFTA